MHHKLQNFSKLQDQQLVLHKFFKSFFYLKHLNFFKDLYYFNLIKSY